MAIYAFYSMYLIPIVFQLPSRTQSLSQLVDNLKMKTIFASIKIIILGFLVGIVLLFSFFLIDIILGDLFTHAIDFNQIPGSPNVSNLGFFHFIQQIVPALWEEIIFRGIILTILLQMCSTRVAVLFSALIFGVFHLANTSPSIYNSVGQLTYTFCFGIILSYLYVKTSNLIPCIVAHYVNNVLSAVIITSAMIIPVYIIYFVLISFFTLIFRMGIIKLYESYSLFL